MPLLLLFLLIAGCASPGRELRRGTPVAPPPPLRPGHGAPVVGQPGQQAPELPRSPHHRPLPPTRGPGLWAGDEPQAAKGTPAKPVLLGVPLPGIPVSEAEADYGPAHLCVGYWTAALPGTRLDDEVRALRGPAKKCVVARMFNLCALLMDGLDRETTNRGVVVLRSKQVRDKFRKSTVDFFQESCPQGLTPDQRRLADLLFGALVDMAHRTD